MSKNRLFARPRPVKPVLSLLMAVLTLLLALLIWLEPQSVNTARERIFDRMIAWSRSDTPMTGTGAPQVVVVDIGEADENGLPWARDSTARLLEKLVAARPAVLALDIVFSGECGTNETNLALATALAKAPTVLGFLLVEAGTLPPSPRPPFTLVADARPFLWQAPGAEAACLAFSRSAAGAASIAILGDADATVRRVPAAVLVGGQPYPGLALEAARIALGVSAPMLGGAVDPWLRLGNRQFGLDHSGQMRFASTGPEQWAARTLAGDAVLSGKAKLEALAGSVVFIGSSVPRRGGLRPTASSPIAPSVQIHADMATALLRGEVPYRPESASMVEAGFATLGGFLAVLLLRLLQPLMALGGAFLLVLFWIAGCLWFVQADGRLLDPVFASLAVIGVALLGLIVQAVASARAERALRAKMGQLLPASVVSRLVDSPDLLRLEGESRVVTVLFSDIEAFSATTHRLGPKALVRMLDEYFELTCGIVLSHGGMIDKIVGDSVHALFNAPLDQPGHVDAALACAEDIRRATETLRQRSDMAAAGLGRTRIGIETGPAVLGDVGSGAKIDYTAHGDAVNLAARLQDSNKELGTTICVGPAAAAAAERTRLRSLGEIDVRSFGRIEVFTLEQPA